MTPDLSNRRSLVRRTALLLGLLALGFYVGFILMAVLRS
jgi:hypothetical protein